MPFNIRNINMEFQCILVLLRLPKNEKASKWSALYTQYTSKLQCLKCEIILYHLTVCLTVNSSRFLLLGFYCNFGKLVVKHMVLKNSMWLHLNSHKNSIFTTILKFNPFTQVNKMYHKKEKLNIGFNKSRIFWKWNNEKFSNFLQMVTSGSIYHTRGTKLLKYSCAQLSHLSALRYSTWSQS